MISKMSQKLIAIAVIALSHVYFYCWNDNIDPEIVKGKRVLITGSSSGIGEHLAYEYSKLGAKVFITARRQNLLEKVAEKCKELGALQVEFITSDLGEQKDRDAVIAEAKKRLGGLDHLILNHAIFSADFWLGTKENMTKFLFELNVNFLSFVDLSSQALPLLTESKGNIGVVSSILGKFSSAGSSSYATSKHAIQGFFSALRQELLLRNTGVSVTTCVIGPVHTDLPKWSPEKNMEIKQNVALFYTFSTAEDTAVAIMNGVVNKKYEIYFGKIAWVSVAIHKMIPGYYEDFYGKFSSELYNLKV